MAKINTIIDRILFYLLAASLAALVCICFVQVIVRYLFSFTFIWVEEVSIILLLWSAWWAACLAMKQGVHLRVRILEDRLTLQTNLILRLALNGLSIAFLIIVLLTSKAMLEGMAYMTLIGFPRLPMNTMYASAPVGCILMIYYLLRSTIKDFKELLTTGK